MGPSEPTVAVEWLIGLGANVGSPEERVERLRLGLHAMARECGGRIVAVSPLYVTEPWGGVDQASFLNGAAVIETRIKWDSAKCSDAMDASSRTAGLGLAFQRAARSMLQACKAVERAMGRQQRERWGPREVDFDILLARRADHTEPFTIDLPADTTNGQDRFGGLTVPHKDMRRRLFALIPAASVGWEAEPVGTGAGLVREAIARLKAEGEVEPAPYCGVGWESAPEGLSTPEK